MRIKKVITSLMLGLSLSAGILSLSATTTLAATSVDTYINNANKLLKKDDPLGALREIRRGMDEHGINNKKLYNKAESIRKHTQIVSETEYLFYSYGPKSPLDVDKLLWNAIEKGRVDDKYFLKLSTKKYKYKNNRLVNVSESVTAKSKVPKAWEERCNPIKWESSVKAEDGVYKLENLYDVKYDSKGRISEYKIEYPGDVVGKMRVSTTFGYADLTVEGKSSKSRKLVSYQYDSKGRVIYEKVEFQAKYESVEDGTTEWLYDQKKDDSYEEKTVYNNDGSYTVERISNGVTYDWIERRGGNIGLGYNYEYDRYKFDKNGDMTERKYIFFQTENPVNFSEIDNFDTWYKDNTIMYGTNAVKNNKDYQTEYYSDKYKNYKYNEVVSPATAKYFNDDRFSPTIATGNPDAGYPLGSWGKVTRDKKGRIVKFDTGGDEVEEFTYDDKDRLLTHKIYDKNYKRYTAKWEYVYEADGGCSVSFYEGSDKLVLSATDKYDRNGFLSEQIEFFDDGRIKVFYGYPYFSTSLDTPTYEERVEYTSTDGYKNAYIPRKYRHSVYTHDLVDDFGNAIYTAVSMDNYADWVWYTKIKYHYDPKYVNQWI